MKLPAFNSSTEIPRHSATFYGGRAFQSSQQIEPAGWGFLEKIGNTISNTAKDVGHAVSETAEGVVHAVGKAAESAGEAFLNLSSKFGSAVLDAGSFFGKASCLVGQVGSQKWQCLKECGNPDRFCFAKCAIMPGTSKAMEKCFE
ncbi:hypothetical protein [Chitinophaga sp. Cy-1792]|uniref:hypothetical protein n=1 Tax=Chitinophaga sp. Cy-1792 TaxID=2608339 RepID=UPI001421E6FD|nr:hypothetical protein [Chitinophaga sp. Cy-1792]NIG54986.1 hypothetical protein [Chitinophaga sp. Cy-1792]